jgi:hypothetical protein
MLSSLTNNGIQNVSGSSGRSSHYKTLFDTTVLPYNKTFNNCSNTLCYTASKGTFIYKPHTATGMVGTTAAARRARRTRV